MEDILVDRLKSFNVNNDNQNMSSPFGKVSKRKEKRKKMKMIDDADYESTTKNRKDKDLKQVLRFEDTSLHYCNQEIINNRRQTSIMPSSNSFNRCYDLPPWSSWFFNNSNNKNNNKTASKSRLPVAATASTITLCHLKLAILILCSLFVQSYIKLGCVIAQPNHQHHAYFDDQMLPQRMPMSDSVPMTMPAYFPTRMPINPSHHHNNNNAVTPNSALASTSTSTPASASASALAPTTSQQHQQQVFANRNLDPRPSSSSSKFIRTNELDVFLDDINHNELRAIASGKPINDLFKPKIVPAEGVVSHNSNGAGEGGGNSASRKQQEETARSQLDSSGSEQQIYSECALILQRTYVKNINDPK